MGPGETSVTRRPLPPTFTPPPRLGAEPAPDASVPGHAWLVQLHGKLHECWSDAFLEHARMYAPPTHPLNDSSLTVILELVIDLEGTLVDLVVSSPSGNRDFDAAALEVVREAAPFPAPPVRVASDDGLVHLKWTFARDVRQDGVSGAAIEIRELDLARAVPALLAMGRFEDAAARLAGAFEAGDTPPTDVATR
jgi:TonB family protein